MSKVPRNRVRIPAPAKTGEQIKATRTIEDYMAPLDSHRNRAGIVPPPGAPPPDDMRRRMFLGKHRLGKRWTEIILAVQDGCFTWEEFVETLDASEIARGQLKDKYGRFRGRPPTFVPRAFFEACTRELYRRGRMEYEKAYLAAVETLTEISRDGRKDADRIKAATFIIERLEGKAPEKVEIKVSDPFSDLVDGAIASIQEEAAIANAHNYFERMGSDEVSE